MKCHLMAFRYFDALHQMMFIALPGYTSNAKPKQQNQEVLDKAMAIQYSPTK